MGRGRGRGEWDAFMAALRRPLPITFRINGSGRFAAGLRQKFEEDFLSQFAAAGEMRIDGELIDPPTPLPWYPDNLAWQMDFNRAQLRKLPVLEEIHEFLKRENEVGGITRQEAVSMVPPLLLDVAPHHRVLDMCAAPGSKTYQLLEMLHAGPEPPTGFVLANDADLQRCNLLTHQTKRHNSPALLVTNHEAQLFPLIHNLDPSEQARRGGVARAVRPNPLRRPLLRRRDDAQGPGHLAPLLRITLRACELLRVGGRLVYSTCSFNPVEDEAVVAEVLRRTGGAFQLLDASESLPALRRAPGLKRWRVMDREGAWFADWEAGKQGVKLDPTMFPDAASDALPLERCMRFLPHHQDTGGFFVAVLQKACSHARCLAGAGVAPIDRIEPLSMAHRMTQGKALRAAHQARKTERAEQRKRQRLEGGEAGAGAGAEGAEGEEAAAPEGAEGDEAAAAPEGAEGERAAPECEQAAAAEGEEGAAAEGEDAAAAEVAQPGPGAGAAPEAGPAPRALPAWASVRAAQRSRAAAAAAELAAATAAGNTKAVKQAQRQRWRGIDPILPYVDKEQLAAISGFYGLPEGCPITGVLIARTPDPRPKRLHFVSPSSDARDQLRVTAAGVKVFERQESRDGLLACAYRLAQDGLPTLLPYLHRQAFAPTMRELMALLQERTVVLPAEARMHITPKEQQEGGQQQHAEQEPAARQEAGAPAAEAQRFELADPETLAQLQELAFGCCVAVLRPADAATLGFEPPPAPAAAPPTIAGAAAAAAAAAATAAAGGEGAAGLAVACWRGRGSLNVLVSKQECAQIAERVHEAARKAGIDLPLAPPPPAGKPAGKPAAEQGADGAPAAEQDAELRGEQEAEEADAAAAVA
eukprot:scaffold2.g7303.t1